MGRYEEALAIGRETTQKRINALGEQARDSVIAMRKVASAALDMGLIDEAESWLDRAERALLATGRENDPELVYVLDGKASALLSRDDPERAIEILERSMRIAEAAFGPETSTVGVVKVNLGNAHLQAGDRPRARDLYGEAVTILRARLGDDHDWTMMAVDNLAMMTARLGDPDGAEAMLEENLARRRRVMGEDHPAIAHSVSSMGMAMASRGEWGRAAAQFRRAAEMHLASSGGQSDPYISALSNAAFCLFRAGDLTGAEEAQRAVLDVERARATEGRRLWGDLRMLVRITLARGDPQGSLAALDELRRAALVDGELSPGRARMLAALEARAKVLAHADEVSVAALAAAAEALLEAEGPDDGDAVDAVRDLVAALRSLGDTAGAEAWERRIMPDERGQ